MLENAEKVLFSIYDHYAVYFKIIHRN